MREILFRGKEVEYDDWLEGYYAIVGDKHVIIRKELDTYYSPDHDYEERRGAEIVQILPQSVGQFTNFYDKRGKKIFEGDILKYVIPDPPHADSVGYAEVIWDNGWKLQFRGHEPEETDQEDLSKYTEIVGNIWDTPELLGVKR